MSKPTLDDYRRELLNIRDSAVRGLAMLDAVEDAVTGEGKRIVDEATRPQPQVVIDGKMVAQDDCDHPENRQDQISGFGSNQSRRCRDCGKEWAA